MIDFENANEIFDVYGTYPKETGKQKMLLGRFVIQNGQLQVIEDHHKILSRTLVRGPVGWSIDALNSLASSPYTQVVAESEVKEGKHIDLVPKGQEGKISADSPQPGQAPDVVQEVEDADAPQTLIPDSAPPRFSMQTPPAVFDYMRVGMKEPQVIEVRGRDVFMNGRQLSTREVERITYTLQTGLGKLRYRKKV